MLQSPEIAFSYGGVLPKPRVNLAFDGEVENYVLKER